MAESIENLVAEFLLEKIQEAALESPLYGVELHDTVFQTIKTDEGVRVGDCESDLVPNSSGDIREVDALLTLVCYSRVKGTDKSDRMEARDRCIKLTKAVVQLFFDDSSMGGRVCDVVVLSIPRSYDSISAQPYAVANLPLLVNPTGQLNVDRRVS